VSPKSPTVRAVQTEPPKATAARQRPVPARLSIQYQDAKRLLIGLRYVFRSGLFGTTVGVWMHMK
jgi:hypothetical protein